jgi:hypothetical protein
MSLKSQKVQFYMKNYLLGKHILWRDFTKVIFILD